MIFNTFHSVSSISIIWLFFFTLHSKLRLSRFHLIFFFFPCFSCRYAPLRRPIHQVTHRPESVSGCLYFPEKSAQFCTAPRCLAACPPHFALRGSKFQIRGVTDQRAEPPLSSGSILPFSVRLEWQCQVSPNRWVWQSG